MYSRKQAEDSQQIDNAIVAETELYIPDSEQAGPWYGLQPAYRDNETGEVHLAMAGDGTLSDVHTFDGLPNEWIALRDEEGRTLALQPQVVAGFWRAAEFIEVGGTLALPCDD